jgi:hypothetical protein
MITKEVIADLKKYSFLDNAERKGIYVILEYHIKEVKKSKRLPLRTSIPQLQKVLKNIQNEKGVSIYGTGYNADYYII